MKSKLKRLIHNDIVSYRFKPYVFLTPIFIVCYAATIRNFILR